MKKTGFTLIELLVVVAIIGLISSIVLASLQSSRAKAYDASIKETMHQVRTAVALYYSTTGTYTYSGGGTKNLCSTFTNSVFVNSPQVDILLDNIDAYNGGAAVLCTLFPLVSPNSWTVESALRSDPAVTWCVDSNGFAGEGVGVTSGGVARCQ